MEIVVIDTCSIINLINSNLASEVLGDENFTFVIGPAVRLELSKESSQLPELAELEQRGLLKYYNKPIDITLIGSLFTEFDLGDGETECIAIALIERYKLCCDDRKARKAAENKIGQPSCYGSIGALKKAVCTGANAGYNEMKSKGGFLPSNIDRSYFCKSS
jgi:predicted nucleic acid-binding protein